LEVRLEGVSEFITKKGVMLYAGVKEEYYEGILQLADIIISELGSGMAKRMDPCVLHMTLARIFNSRHRHQQQMLNEAPFPSLADPRHEFLEFLRR
jgi:2'-5' RNA ligase